MIRTQVQLDSEQVDAVRRLAAERGISMAAVVRDAVARLIGEADRDGLAARARKVIGKYHSGIADVAAEHDRYLEEDFLDWRRS